MLIVGFFFFVVVVVILVLASSSSSFSRGDGHHSRQSPVPLFVANTSPFDSFSTSSCDLWRGVEARVFEVAEVGP
ncbi:hypothetical protein B296_00007302 [Ensete ventricosum]|uniref:Secreted protein n=1 Tax=Ensete ventricosum TaxID=4639 RepID=A0A427B7J4_ENSVE|nr:hypothetical protein B296_00007302 [Ensete ventricosum]